MAADAVVPDAREPLEAAGPDPVERFHALDSLRAAAMLLGVFFHAALAYVDPPQTYWIVQDQSRHLLFGVLVWGSHSFRMHLFFTLAGFMARLVFQRYGTARFVRHRGLRLAVPFTVGVLLDNALQQSFFHHAYVQGWFIPDSAALAAAAPAPLSASRYLDQLSLGVYWFLEYLICFSLSAVAVVSLRGAAAYRRLQAALDRHFPALFRSRLRWLYLAFVPATLLYPTREWGVGSPSGLLPELTWLLYYGLYFGFGWLLHRYRWLLPELQATCARDLALAACVGALALATAAAGHLGHVRDTLPARASALVLTSSFGWLMIFGLMGLFLRLFRREHAAVRYVSDSSYWLYLTHDYYVMALQILLAPLALAAGVKYAIVIGTALPLLIVSYDLGVRYTFIGAVLNGRKRRSGLE
jgi:hypothetical protein